MGWGFVWGSAQWKGRVVYRLLLEGSVFPVGIILSPCASHAPERAAGTEVHSLSQQDMSALGMEKCHK